MKFKNMNHKFYLLILFFFINILQVFSQVWQDFEKENIIHVEVRDSTYNIENFTFDAVKWEDGPYKFAGGELKELHIYKDNELIQVMEGIKETLEMNPYLIFTFYDYNLDGHIDFRILRDCGKTCYFDYYLFNPETQKFELAEDWKWVRIDEINKDKKQFWDFPSGTAVEGSRDLYQIEEGNKLRKIKTISY